MDRAQKQELVASLHRTFEEAGLVVVTHNTGLSVSEVTSLRRQVRAAGAGFKVTKNRLARRALEGTRYTGLAPLFTGPTAIAFSRDPVAAAKVAVTFAEGSERLRIVGGAMGEQVLTPEGVKALATLPSLEELRGRMLRLLQTPAARVAAVLQAPAGQLARVFTAYAGKGEAA